MRNGYRYIAVAAAGALTLALTACGSSSSSSTSSSPASTGSSSSTGGASGTKVGPKTVGLLYVLKAAEFSNRNGAAINAAADSLGWKVNESDPAGDPQKAISGLTGFISQKVDAILSATWEASVIRQPLLAAQQAGIPVVDIWGGVKPSPLFAGTLATDETLFGTVGSEAFLKLLNSGDKVAMLTSSAYTFGSARDEAFKALAGPKGVNIVASHDTDYTNAQADTTKAVKDILAANPDLNGIFADSSLHIPAIEAVLKAQGLCGKVKVLGFYGDLPNLAAVRDGCVDIIADAPVMAQSWVVMDLLAKHFADGSAIPTSFPTDYPFDPAKPFLITKANVPTDPAKYADVDFDYVNWFKDRWAKGLYGPSAS